MTRLYIIGDIHGQYQKMIALLRRANLIDGDLAWSGGDATLCFMGDYVDRGPDGLRTIETVQRLQAESQTAGGEVIALMGNHEVFLLSAYFFGKRSPTSGRLTGVYVDDWLMIGGVRADLDGLTAEHVRWIQSLPVMAKVEDWLLVHADALMYLVYGTSTEEVNDAVRAVLTRANRLEWNELLQHFIRRRAFQGKGSLEQARNFLEIYGGEQIVHGHTPISQITGQRPQSVTEPYIYANGLCVDVDAGLFLGSDGFVYTPST